MPLESVARSQAIIPQRVGPRNDRLNQCSFNAGTDSVRLGGSLAATSLASPGSRTRGQKRRTHRDSGGREIAMA
jgi:hypothetical protein